MPMRTQLISLVAVMAALAGCNSDNPVKPGETASA